MPTTDIVLDSGATNEAILALGLPNPNALDLHALDLNMRRQDTVDVDLAYYQSLLFGPRASDLCEALESYLPAWQIREVYRAYLFSAEAHDGQVRQSGDPYIYHPLAVAVILARLQLDYKCIMAALLHDVIEDTGVIKEALVREFDAEIADLVDGVSKLTKIDNSNHAEVQAANISKMLLAMTKDIRVIFIKLADRLHNMRTLGSLRRDKAKRIAKETLEIYGPIAHRLGINSICMELEDLGFRQRWPWRYRILSHAVTKTCELRTSFINTVRGAIQTQLQKSGIDGVVISRQKHLYAIYRKMKTKQRRFSQVVDFYGIRVIVDEMDTCYRTLGIVHGLYQPVYGRFKDFIAIPKVNGYQSLHTLVIGPNGTRAEVQIRTKDMHKIAEFGIAAHWLYKLSETHVNKVHPDWMKEISPIEQGAKDPIEFLESIKMDLFTDEVCVFTPHGKILTLPQGSTVVDFAYAVHTDVGNNCAWAKINHRLVPLRTTLQSGQTVEIITSPTAVPRPNWLNFVITSKARTNIRQCLKQQAAQEASVLGKSLMKQELQIANIGWEQIPKERLQSALHGLGISTIEDLWSQIGLGHISPRLVAWKLQGFTDVIPAKCSGGCLVIDGSEGLVVNFGKCCHPILGDSIIGTLNPGRGLVVHREGCRNIGDIRRRGHNWLEIEWDSNAKIDLPSEITVDMGNMRGALATIATAIANAGSNIENFHFDEHDGLSAALKLLLMVHNRTHLSQIMRKLKAIPSVMGVTRVFHRMLPYAL